jgi:hypothetical protein
MQQDLLDKFGPCGLLCEKCFAYDKGPIYYHAEKLKQNLGEFDNYANRFATLLDEPKFANYPVFKEFLSLLSSSNCKGCRKQDCHLFSSCKVKDCYKEKKVDFCFQCTDFSCDHTGFDENLEKRWLKINYRIREIGLENYYDEIKDKPRY